MPETFQSLAVLLLALLPGALYVWAFEREAGAWGVRLADRLFRFVGFSAAFHALLAPVTYRLWADFARPGTLGSGTAPLWLWPVAIAYVAGPMALGTSVGLAARARKRWARMFTGPDPAPRAWDGSRSYAAGYPEEQDLYLVEAVEVDAESGSFIVDEDGNPVSRGSAILVRWNEVEYLDFYEA